MVEVIMAERTHEETGGDEAFDLIVGDLEWDIQDKSHKMLTTLDTCWNPTTCNVNMYCC